MLRHPRDVALDPGNRTLLSTRAGARSTRLGRSDFLDCYSITGENRPPTRKTSRAIADDAPSDIDKIKQMILNGRKDEARRILNDLKEKARYSPTEIGVGRDNKPTFKARGRHVRQNEDGQWVPAPKSKKP